MLLGRKTIPPAATAYVAALAPGKTKDQVAGAIARQLARSDPQTALAWVQELPDDGTRQNSLETVLTEWSETDPKAAAEFAVQNSSGRDTLENLIAAISYQWAQTNPAAALAWTQDLSDPAVRDAILPSMVSAAAEDNPSATDRDDIASFW